MKNIEESLEDKKIHIGIIAKGDVDNKRRWSGTVSNLASILREKYIVTPININDNLTKFIEKTGIVLAYIFSLGKNKKSKFSAKIHALALQNRIRRSNCDIIFAPAVSDILAYCSIPEKMKIIYLSDATYHVMINYYYFNHSMRDQAVRNDIERRALVKADAVIHASDWARNDAIDFYHIPKEKLYMFPFGANLEDHYTAHKSLPYSKLKKIQLLFVGVDWERKGADIAIECVRLLNKRSSIEYELTIIGLAPKEEKYESFIYFVGYLNKNNRRDYDRLLEYYQNSDIFILPTKAECAGIVFAEAAMFGLPVVTHDTGGVSTYVLDKVSGCCLPLESSGADFADAIKEIVEKDLLWNYSNNARKQYEDRLNWKVWLNEFDRIIENLRRI